MTNTAAAENRTGHPGEKDKEKVEKRRALGRGLESLLPGPRVVAGTAAARTPGQSDGVVGKQPISGRVDSNENASTETEVAVIHGVVEELVEGPAVAAELRSGGQPGAAVPTQTSSTQTVPTQSSPGFESGITLLAQAEGQVPGNRVVNVAIADIDKNPFQTRYVDTGDALTELADSIKANGVLQPVVVRPAEDEGRYILVLGERRLRASKLAGKDTVPAIVRRLSDQQAAEMTIIENLQREDLSPLEQAEAFRVLSEEFKMTQQEIGKRVGLSRESVANYMRLLRLPREVMQLLAEKRITFAEAKELLKLESNDQISQAAIHAVKKGMSFEQVERLVMQMNGLLDPVPGMRGQEKKKSGARWVDPNVRAAQLELERLLGMRVRIRDRKGKGKIVIEYATVDDYERVVEALRGKA